MEAKWYSSSILELKLFAPLFCAPDPGLRKFYTNVLERSIFKYTNTIGIYRCFVSIFRVARVGFSSLSLSQIDLDGPFANQEYLYWFKDSC